MADGFERLGTLPNELIPEFERCFEIRFLRRCCCRVLFSGAAESEVSLRCFWPTAHKMRMKLYFQGWCDANAIVLKSVKASAEASANA